jgi:hypothetical protein
MPRSGGTNRSTAPMRLVRRDAGAKPWMQQLYECGATPTVEFATFSAFLFGRAKN